MRDVAGVTASTWLSQEEPSDEHALEQDGPACATLPAHRLDLALAGKTI
jgi:hypothetical protein